MKAELLMESRMTPSRHRKHSSSYENEIIAVYCGYSVGLLCVPGAGDFTSVADGGRGEGGSPLNILSFKRLFFLLEDSERYSITQWIDMVWIQRQYGIITNTLKSEFLIYLFD